MAIVVFLAVMLATVGLTFILENLRPRVEVLPETSENQYGPRARRTA
jgi:hypothetical protein